MYGRWRQLTCDGVGVNHNGLLLLLRQLLLLWLQRHLRPRAWLIERSERAEFGFSTSLKLLFFECIQREFLVYS